ncbi:hypothetical protein [Sulfobacillus thermosulfidooxidans]|nr:hypothetical protein [Sulfobacillus thermosulfidooxidans]
MGESRGIYPEGLDGTCVVIASVKPNAAMQTASTNSLERLNREEDQR